MRQFSVLFLLTFTILSLFGFALWYNECAEWQRPFAAERCFIMDGHPLELPPVYPRSQGAPIVFAVPLDFSWFGETSHETAYGVRCPVHR